MKHTSQTYSPLQFRNQFSADLSLKLFICRITYTRIHFPVSVSLLLFISKVRSVRYFSLITTVGLSGMGKHTEQQSQTLHIYSVSFGAYIVPCGSVNAGLLLFIIMITRETMNFSVRTLYFQILVYFVTKLD